MWGEGVTVSKTALISDTNCEVREQFTRPPLLVTSIVSLGVPKTTLSFNNSLEGLTEFTGSYCTHGYGLLQLKNTDENQPREETHGVEFRKMPDKELLVLFSWSWAVFLFQQQCEAAYQVLPTREAHLGHGVQRFHWGFVVHCLCDWSLVSSPSRHRVDAIWVKAPIINHSVRLPSDQGPQINEELLSGRAFWRPNHLPIVEGKGWDCWLGKVNSLLHILWWISLCISFVHFEGYFFRLISQKWNDWIKECPNLYSTPPQVLPSNVSEYLFYHTLIFNGYCHFKRLLAIWRTHNRITWFSFLFLWLLVRVYTHMFIFKAFIMQDFEYPEKLRE